MTAASKRFLSFAGAMTGFVLVLVACSSIPNVTFSDEEGGVIPEGGTSSGDVVIGCTPTGPEVCDDGIDNDCNGKTDCEDPACTAGYSCQDMPAGWSPVAFADKTRPACPASTTATDLKVTAGDGSATGTCACSCTSVGGSCTTGNWTVTIATDATCTAGATTLTVPLTSGCAATAVTRNVPTGAFLKVTGPAAPTSCNATGAGFGLADGRACQATKFGKGCTTPGQVCAPKPASGFAACVAKDGKDTCPSNFTKRNTAGTAANDTRTCNGCTCNGPAPCTGGGVDVYDNNGCKTNGNNDGAEGITTTCASAQPKDNFTITHFISRAPGGGGCVPATASGTPSGVATFTAGERTVCCK